jgi:hypothetical protein
MRAPGRRPARRATQQRPPAQQQQHDGPLAQKGTKLVHQRRPFRNQPFTHPVQRLDIELRFRLERSAFSLNREGFPKGGEFDSTCWLERRPARMAGANSLQRESARHAMTLTRPSPSRTRRRLARQLSCAQRVLELPDLLRQRGLRDMQRLAARENCLIGDRDEVAGVARKDKQRL